MASHKLEHHNEKRRYILLQSIKFNFIVKLRVAVEMTQLGIK